MHTLIHQPKSAKTMGKRKVCQALPSGLVPLALLKETRIWSCGKDMPRNSGLMCLKGHLSRT